jgi:hypothetical protein
MKPDELKSLVDTLSKVIEQAQRLERESYKAMMRKRRVLQGATTLDTIA